MKKKRKKRVQKQKQEALQLTRNPFDRDPFRKKQQHAITGGEEALHAPRSPLKTKESIQQLEKMNESSK